MSAGRLDRRQLLKGLGAGALAAGAAVTLAPTAFASDSVVGSWRIRIHQGAHTTPGVASFATGGTMASTDAGSPGTGLGVWEQQSDGPFEFKFVAFDFSHGPPGATVLVSGKGTQNANTVAGTFSVTVGGHSAGGGTFDGTRMTV